MAKKSNLSEMSTADLKSKLSSIRKIQLTVAIIFGVIILAWIVLGYWKTNVPVFISTVAVSITSVAAMTVSSSALAAELKKRENPPQ